MRTLLVLTVISGLAVGSAADEVAIEDFDYDSPDVAQATWQPQAASPVVGLVARDGGTALRIDCPFTQDTERSYCDQDVELDLSRLGRFTFELFVDDPTPLGRFSIYFRSGAGWYGANVQGERGWHTYELAKSDFRIEDSPGGWSRIDGIRLSQWKASEGDTYVAVDNLIAHSADIAVVMSARAREVVPDEARAIEQFAQGMEKVLAGAGIVVDVLTDDDIVEGALEGRQVVIFAYAPSMDDEVLARAREFVDGGGKAFLFYSLAPGMAEILGVRMIGRKEAGGQPTFARVAFEEDAVPGLPASVQQDSWNINSVEPARDDARIIGWWENDEGERSGDVAMVLSDTGVYMGHVVTNADATGKQKMMTALLGHFVPDVWARKAEHTIETAAHVGPCTSLGDLEALVASAARDTGAARQLQPGREALRAAQAAADAGNHPLACERADEARAAFREAYVLAQPTRHGEFRGMWEHSGTGPYPEAGWGRALDIMQEAGLNAIVPNMWWAGVAHYDSEYLPHSPQFDQYGDQIEQCVEEAHKRGIEVHAWKVNWNLSRAPQEFVDQLRADGRTMVTFNGEPVNWLCPSHPENYQLELDTMVEVARKYDVDGVHFDYIRYMNESVCYCDGCRERFQRDAGVTVEDWPMDCYRGPLMEQYRDWRCDQITRLVRSTSEEVRKIKPWVKISAAVFSNYPGTKRSIGQDWLLWVKEGYLDFVCPMDYTSSDPGFRRTVARQVAQVAGRVPLCPGIGASAPGQPADQTVHQIAIAREAGADGFTIFQLSRTTAEDHVPAAGRGVLSGKPTHTTVHAPDVVFGIPGELDEVDGAVHLAWEPVRIVMGGGLGQQRKEVEELLHTYQLETTTGEELEVDLELHGGNGGDAWIEVQPRTGRLRVADVGELVFEDGTKAPYTVRSVPFVFDEE